MKDEEGESESIKCHGNCGTTSFWKHTHFLHNIFCHPRSSSFFITKLCSMDQSENVKLETEQEMYLKREGFYSGKVFLWKSRILKEN